MPCWVHRSSSRLPRLGMVVTRSLVAIVLGCATDTKDCEENLASGRPCAGLLPLCTPGSGLRDVPSTHAFSDCPLGTFHTKATVNHIYLPSAGIGINVNFLLDEPPCNIGFDVVARAADWPIWPWLVNDAQVGVDLWDTGGDARGGDPLWMSLRDRDTNELLMTMYQLDHVLIEDGTVSNELGFGVERLGPVCEYGYGPSVGDSVAVHAYELRFSTSNTTVTLGGGQIASLPASNSGRSLQIQTGSLKRVFASESSLSSLVDQRYGSAITFVAWTDP